MEGAAAFSEISATANCNPVKAIFLKAIHDSRIFGCAVLYNGRVHTASFGYVFGAGLNAPALLAAVARILHGALY
jgi:hypothetical protein